MPYEVLINSEAATTQAQRNHLGRDARVTTKEDATIVPLEVSALSSGEFPLGVHSQPLLPGAAALTPATGRVAEATAA